MQITTFSAMLKGLLLVGYLLSNMAWAHGGEDHAEPVSKSPQLGEQAQRQLDGSVYVPKAVQYLWQLQTGKAQLGQWPLYLQLPATVVLDPAAEGVVEAAQLGRLSAGPNGYPAVGQQITAGQVLAYLQPQDSTLDRSNQQALLAELHAQIRLTEDRIKRLGRLGTLVAQSELDNARIELAGLQQRYSFAQKATGKLLPIIAPVSGTLSVVHKQVNQYVQAQEPLFLILHSQSLLIEALSYQSAEQQQLLQLPAAATATATAATAQSMTAKPLENQQQSSQQTSSQQQWSLQFSGAGAALRQQALPLYFRAAAKQPALLLGQTLQVQVALPQQQSGILLPASALLRRDNGDWVVWLKTAPEQFRMQQVTFAPASAGYVLVTGGLATDALVVLQGTGWLMQVR